MKILRINQELEKFSEKLFKKEQLVFANKIDIIYENKEKIISEFKEKLIKQGLKKKI